MDDIVIEPMTRDDAEAVLRVYQEGIATGHATFEEKTPPWAEWDRGHLKDCRLVARSHDGLLGWAALSPVSGRCVYGGVAEVSVYVAAAARGRRVGAGLLAGLVDESERSGIWTMQAGIFPENIPSVALHAAAGFRVVGTREKLGRMAYGPLAGQWRDVVLMERRSPLEFS